MINNGQQNWKTMIVFELEGLFPVFILFNWNRAVAQE